MERSSIISTNILKCRQDGVCFNGNLTVTREQSYTGPLCQACNNSGGYVRSSSNKCRKCTYSTLVIVFIAIGIILLGLGYIHLSLDIIYEFTKNVIASINPQPIQDNISSTIYLRLIMTYSQIIFIVNSAIASFSSALEKTAINNLQIVFGFTGILTSSLVYSNICLFIGSTMNLYNIEIILSTALPLLLILLLTIVYLCFWRLKLNRSRLCKLGNMIICVIMISQPGVVQKLLNYMQCTSPDNNSTLYVYSEMGYQCHADSYNSFLLTFVLPSLLI